MYQQLESSWTHQEIRVTLILSDDVIILSDDVINDEQLQEMYRKVYC